MFEKLVQYITSLLVLGIAIVVWNKYQTMTENKIVRKVIKTEKGGLPKGPFSQALIVDRTMYISGRIGVDPATDDFAPGGIAAQTEQIMKNLGAILKEAGIDYGNVVKTTVFLADIKEWPAFNEVYAKYFTERFPARSAVQVAALPRGARVEMEAIAMIGEISDQ